MRRPETDSSTPAIWQKLFLIYCSSLSVCFCCLPPFCLWLLLRWECCMESNPNAELHFALNSLWSSKVHLPFLNTLEAALVAWMRCNGSADILPKLFPFCPLVASNFSDSEAVKILNGFPILWWTFFFLPLLKKACILFFPLNFPALFLSGWWMACIWLVCFLYYSVRITRHIDNGRAGEEKGALAQCSAAQTSLRLKVGIELPSGERRGRADGIRWRGQDVPAASFHTTVKNFLTVYLN